MKFKLSSSITINSNEFPFSKEGLRIGIYGQSGSGKSYIAAFAYIEPFLEQKGTVVIFQPRAEWYTLKEKFQQVVVVGGDYLKDLDVLPGESEVYAEAIVNEGVSMVIHTGDFEDQEKQIKFVVGLIRRVMRLQEGKKEGRRPIMFVFEEGHEYAPLSAKGAFVPPWIFNTMIKTVNDVFSGGRKLNITSLLISQRPQQLNFAIRQLINISHFGVFSSQDIKYLKKEVFPAFEDKGIKIESNRLLDLKDGEWLVVSRKAEFIHTNIKRKTTHGADTPNLDYVAPQSSQIKGAVSDLGERLKELLSKSEEEQSEVQNLKSTIKRRDEKISEIERKLTTMGDLREMLSSSSGKGGVSPIEVEKKLVEKDVLISEKIEELAEMRRLNNGIISQQEKQIQTLKAESEFGRSFSSMIESTINSVFNNGLEDKIVNRIRSEITAIQPTSGGNPEILQLEKYKNWISKLPKGEGDIITALLEDPESRKTLEQISFLTRQKKGTTAKYISNLRKNTPLIDRSSEGIKIKA